MTGSTLYTAVQTVSAAALLARHWPDGSRHDASLALSGLLLRGGWNVPDTENFITTIAQTAGDEEWKERARNVETTAKRLNKGEAVRGGPSLGKLFPEPVARQAAEWLGVDASEPASGQGAVIVCAADVKPEKIRWIWPGRIAAGKLTVLDSDPGLGKTTLTLDLAARLSSGRPMPNSDLDSNCEPGNVLIVSCEDGIAATLVPRLIAAGADLRNIHFFDGIQDSKGVERLPSLPDDISEIRKLIEQRKTRLVVIDPLMAFLGENVDSHKDQGIRRALAPLARVADKTGAGILMVRHLTKQDHGKAIYAGGGSIGIIGQARTGLMLTEDPGNADDRILSVTKCNVAAKAPSLRFRFNTGGPDQEFGVPRIEWIGEVELSADELVRGRAGPPLNSPRDEAVHFIREALAERPMSAKWMKEEAEKRGISIPTLERAKESLHFASRRREWFVKNEIQLGEPNSSDDLWFWWIPPKDWKKQKPGAPKTAKAGNMVSLHPDAAKPPKHRRGR